MDFLTKKCELIKTRSVPTPFFIEDFYSFHFKWIMDVETDIVLGLRNAPHVHKSLPDSKKIEKIDHERFIKNYVNLQRMDFIIIDAQSGCAIGGLNLNKTYLGYEIGKYIGDCRYLRKGIALAATKSFLRFIESHFTFLEHVCAKTLASNFGNINLNKRLGFYIESTMDDYILMKKRIETECVDL